MREGSRRPSSLQDALASYLEQSGLAHRVLQAGAVPDWPRLVGPQIAAATEPLSVSADGTLFVGVTTNAWMSELSLLEPELLRTLNAREGAPRVQRIRWLLRR